MILAALILQAAAPAAGADVVVSALRRLRLSTDIQDGKVATCEATTSKISEDQMFYAQSRGLDSEAAVALIVNGFAREVLQQLPMEFAVEAQKLLGISLEGSVG